MPITSYSRQEDVKAQNEIKKDFSKTPVSDSIKTQWRTPISTEIFSESSYPVEVSTD